MPFVNGGYRGEGSKRGWTTEADILGGQRTDPEKMLELIGAADSRVELAFAEDGALVGCVHLKKEAGGSCYLGMLTVDPARQAGGIGKLLMAHADGVARAWDCARMRMTVISVRAELIAYYERRGYAKTGASEPFPENDPRFGLPKVRGLTFVELEKALVTLAYALVAVILLGEIPSMGRRRPGSRSGDRGSYAAITVCMGIGLLGRVLFRGTFRRRSGLPRRPRRRLFRGVVGVAGCGPRRQRDLVPSVGDSHARPVLHAQRPGLVGPARRSGWTLPLGAASFIYGRHVRRDRGRPGAGQRRQSRRHDRRVPSGLRLPHPCRRRRRSSRRSASRTAPIKRARSA